VARAASEKVDLMSEIPVLDPSEAPRARRWDALVLGSGLAAMVAAARIGARGARVLVVEETRRTTLPPALREPFFLGGLRDEGVVDAALRTLTVPLIDRRRIAAERLAFQIAADPFRLDVGQPALTADELVTWGLRKPDDALTLVRRLVEASEIERQRLLESPFVRLGRRLSVSRHSGSPIGNHKRGLPGDVAGATGDLKRILDAQIRALSNLGTARPTPEAQARLLGLGLAGGAGFSDSPPWLVDLMRKRVTGHYGDFRSSSGDFELVSVSGQPGIRISRTGELWLGRVLVLGAAPSRLFDLLAERGREAPPTLLDRGVSRGYRAALLYRVPTSVLPEGMGARLILPGASDAEPTIAVTAFPSQTHPNRVDLVARAMVPDADPARLEQQIASLRADIARRLRDLMPFCGDRLDEVETDSPRWDGDDGWLEDPLPGQGWPGETDLRLSSRPPIYHLDRGAVAGLGLEGDLLLGWRAGDAIAEELA
jgi:hypothetical protein